MKKKPIQSSRILYMIVALIGSVALWIYVRSEVNPYSDPWIYRIPVTFEGEDVLNEDRSLIVLSGADTTVDLHLYGKRLDTATLNRSNIQITVDLSTIRSAGTYSLDYDISFPDSISANAITVRERSPSSVQLTVGKLQTKSIPVKGSGGSPAEGYLAETIDLRPRADYHPRPGGRRQDHRPRRGLPRPRQSGAHCQRDAGLCAGRRRRQHRRE